METRLSKQMRERSPLWSVMIDHEDLASAIFSWFSGNDFKFLSSVNRESRRVLFKRRVVPKRFRSERLETASTINFALDHGLKMDYALLCKAVEAGNVELLQYLCARGLNLKESALPYYASKYGRIDTLKHVKENVLCEWNARECLEFARSARFEALEEKRKKKRKTKIDEFLVQRLSQTIEWLETQIRDGHDGVTHLFQE